MDAVLFWDMTYGEIMAAIEGYQKRFKSDLQMQAIFTYKLGELIGIAVNDPKKYPGNVKEAFKKTRIFDDIEEGTSKQQNWQVIKERVNNYNTYLKQKRGETN